MTNTDNDNGMRAIRAELKAVARTKSNLVGRANTNLMTEVTIENWLKMKKKYFEWVSFPYSQAQRLSISIAESSILLGVNGLVPFGLQQDKNVFLL